MRANDEMWVSEVFGPTMQGEGPYAGRPVGFLRLGQCNLSCVWCDTPYTWDWRGRNGTSYVMGEELTIESINVVADKLVAMAVDVIVVSGGEPMLQQDLVARLHDRFVEMEAGISLHMETNGTIEPDPAIIAAIDLFVVSPKLSNAGAHMSPRQRLRNLAAWAKVPQAVFKFVVTEPADMVEINAIIEEHLIDLERVWLMPEARTLVELVARLPAVTETAVSLGCNVSSRLHVAAWGPRRGV